MFLYYLCWQLEKYIKKWIKKYKICLKECHQIIRNRKEERVNVIDIRHIFIVRICMYFHHYYYGVSVVSSALLGGLFPLPNGLFPLGPLLYSGASSSNFLSAFLNVAGITSSTMP